MLLPPIFFTIIIMPCDYWGEAKIKFPLPSYPKEDAFEDSAKYEVAVNGFGLDHQWVLAECLTWVNRKTIADLACESEAARARAVDDKKHCEAEEEKKHWEMSAPGSGGRWILQGQLLQSCRPWELKRCCGSACIAPSEVSCFLLLFIYFVF